MQGYGRLPGPLISAREVVQPGLPWIQQGGVNHDDSTIGEAEGAEIGQPNSAPGGSHHTEVRATCNSCSKPPDLGGC